MNKPPIHAVKLSTYAVEAGWWQGCQGEHCVQHAQAGTNPFQQVEPTLIFNISVFLEYDPENEKSMDNLAHRKQASS